ncbi:2-hydroxyhepta-2,4-diene-1,7-dioate isomerase [Pseudooceanicola sp. 216_PA32_1]|uniref:2-hydroxyhepta-2,4-diene-1,7-dioate isomerase n=1 Tax=Pseudooceanicola pacificus TaxID=2676438 RepID=A0A844W5K2_9RHOB|nr:fumarylacetoacetate hydrolase family protein [Pseudooceanicola pacificus]MWB79137.1 2-hydroxyhepta-2,4-diene-1,7-dioate isomerase [Pseudooceanicola pacificus]
MKLASYTKDGTPGFGIVTEGGILPLDGRLDGIATLQELIEKDALGKAQAVTGDALLDPADVTYAIPVDRPEKIWCIGVNYGNRNAEYKDGSDLPKYPSLFVRSRQSFVGHDAPLERPRVSEQLDYEGEIALVIGKGGRDIPRETALDHIFGLTICNEGTVRDWLRHGKFNVTQGKNFDRSGAIGPWIVTADELDPGAELSLQTRVNGEVRQKDTTANLMFPFDFLISYLSTFATLSPGDIIVTGTPTGAGVRFDPPIWLKPGDVVEVEVPGIGTLSNGVADQETGHA